MVLGFAKYSKRSSETQVSYTLKRSIQNGWAFKMVVVDHAVDHAFNILGVFRGRQESSSFSFMIITIVRDEGV